MMLRELIAECERRWSIRVEAPFPDLSYHYVAPATVADGTSVVLKIGRPNAELSSEIAALGRYDGCGAVHLLDADAERGVLLLERLLPGERLAAIDDDAATGVFAALMQQLQQPGDGFRTLEDWTRALLRAPTNSLVGAAVAQRAELLASSEPVLLHADLHHFNILSAERQPWLAIDPKGIFGDRSYEPAPFLMNPIERVLGDPKLILRRIDLLSERLELDRARVRAWAFVHAVLSACWSREDGEDDAPALRLAEILCSLDLPLRRATPENRK